jgi:DNA-binding transcriptional MerR regulator
VTIGDFSRATHLSVKTLRHSHEVGLLVPTEIDPHTGYRYYTEEQIPTAEVIRRLRALQTPVGDVKVVMSAPDADARNRVIVAHLGRLEAELARTSAAVAELRRLLERPVGAGACRAPNGPGGPGGCDPTGRRPRRHFRLVAGCPGRASRDRPAPGPPTDGAARRDLRRRDLRARPRQRHGVPTAEGAVRAVGRAEQLAIPAAELAVLRHQARPPTSISPPASSEHT